MQSHIKTLPLLLISMILAVFARADVVETASGARLVGKVTKIADGKIYLTTDYAGDLTIVQSEVSAISTDGELSVRLASGTRIDGRVATENGAIQIVGADGTITTSVGKVAASWGSGKEDPQVTAMRRKWKFQVSADVVGKTGNAKSTGAGLGFVAALASPQDELKFYGDYNYATSTDTDGVKTTSTDQMRAGVDYSSFFSERAGWYVRSELASDKVAGVDLRSTSDAGMSYRLIKKPHQLLVGRLGAGYRFESYDDDTPNNDGFVLSTGLNHKLDINSYLKLINDVQFIPSFEDFADYRLTHDSALELPIASGFWKLRMGVSNQYNSRPIDDRKKLDTLYYTRLVLDWQ
ncbi:MAG TPA: DUF481 domain-containing protein [Opitutaceae bacterium]|nr:DUF481 domain-containing protein [Opitutaceae bacterium]HOR25678.1 DUF481 domain-containing protein [Opitutaceae bacterium]HPK49993.1 DUF481 domain-containing protein [Opitutaceae bacterium]